MTSSFIIIFLLLLLAASAAVAVDNAGLSVKYKYAGLERTLRFLDAGVDLPLGGSGRQNAVGLHYAKIGIGMRPRDYYVQVDTGRDIMWVNCIQCKECPSRSSLGFELLLYDIKQSSTGKLVLCDQEFCVEMNNGPLDGCTANMSCPYLQIYGDGTTTAGYFVKDFVLYDRVWVTWRLRHPMEASFLGVGRNLVKKHLMEYLALESPIHPLSHS